MRQDATGREAGFRMIMSFRTVRPLGAAALVAAAAGLACAQDGADPAPPEAGIAPVVAPEIADAEPPPLDLGEADAIDLAEDLFPERLDDLDAPPLDAPPKPELGPEPASWTAWRQGIDARLDRGVFAQIGAALRAPDYLVPRGAGDVAGVRDALSSFFAGGAPFNQRLVAPTPPRRAASAPFPRRPPPGPEGGTADELAGFFAGVAREAERRAGAPPPAGLPDLPGDAPPAFAAPARPASPPPPAFAGPPPLRVAPPASRPAPQRPAPPPRIVAPPPSPDDEPALAEDLADFFADS